MIQLMNILILKVILKEIRLPTSPPVVAQMEAVEAPSRKFQTKIKSKTSSRSIFLINEKTYSYVKMNIIISTSKINVYYILLRK